MQNWHKPCNFLGVLLASHSLHFRVHTRVLLTLAVALIVAAVAFAAPTAPELLRDAAAARQAGDVAGVVARLEAAQALRPDYPRVIYGLARAYTAANRAGDALAQLAQLADMGLTFAIEKDAALQPLRDQEAFGRLTRRFAENSAPRGGGKVAFALPDRDGIIEGIAADAAGNWYFGDVRNRCVWRRDAAGRVTRFAGDPALLGVFGLKADDARGVLWAGTSAVAEMKGGDAADRGHAALVEFELATGQVRRMWPVPADGRDHVLGDVLLLPDGSVFASDSLAPIIWRLAPHGQRLQRWLESADFSSLQGMAPSPDGRSLLVADYANGLWQVSLADQSHSLLRAPAGTTLFGLDGLYAVAGGLLAVQNGVNPQRIVRIALDAGGRPAGVQVLEAGHPAMDDVSLGVVSGGRFHFVGNSGWALFEAPGAAPAPRTVTVFATQI